MGDLNYQLMIMKITLFFSAQSELSDTCNEIKIYLLTYLL